MLFTKTHALIHKLWRVANAGNRSSLTIVLLLNAILLSGCVTLPSNNISPRQVDTILRGGLVFDGTGTPGEIADIAIVGDEIFAIGNLAQLRATTEIDATGLIVAPGFINMLSHAQDSLLHDGLAQSDIRQGVTLEVFGEASYGPLDDVMKENFYLFRYPGSDFPIPVTWTGFGEYLEHLVANGVSPNVASFVGAPNARMVVKGFDDGPATSDELIQMQKIVEQAMKEGALGVTSALIYPPASYATTDELVALATAAGKYGGIFATHIRSESTKLLDAIDEVISIARQSDVPAEIYHLKAAGRDNWPKLQMAIDKIESARKEGLQITADMYLYTAGATQLDATLPPWVQKGGYPQMLKRLKEPGTRERVKQEMRHSLDFENFFIGAGANGILIASVTRENLKKYEGKTVFEISTLLGKDPEDTIIDLIIENSEPILAVYFQMSEENIVTQIALPWVSFGSDANAPSITGVFLDSYNHPRAYGNFALLLSKYVRDNKVIPLREAIRKLTSLPASVLNISKRGKLKKGYFADIITFDLSKIEQRSTYTEPHQYSTGMHDVFVNGVHVLKNGEHTGATPGRIVRGPGWIEPAN